MAETRDTIDARDWLAHRVLSASAMLVLLYGALRIGSIALAWHGRAFFWPNVTAFFPGLLVLLDLVSPLLALSGSLLWITRRQTLLMMSWTVIECARLAGIVYYFVRGGSLQTLQTYGDLYLPDLFFPMVIFVIVQLCRHADRRSRGFPVRVGE